MDGYNLYICMYKSILVIKKYRKWFKIHERVNPPGIGTKVGISGKLWVIYTRTQKPDI
jgi:hypothetical protein